LFKSYEDIFSNSEAEICEFPIIEMEINLSEHKPFRCRPYRVTEPDGIFMRGQIDKWIVNKVCRHSNSPFGPTAFVIKDESNVGINKNPENENQMKTTFLNFLVMVE